MSRLPSRSNDFRYTTSKARPYQHAARSTNLLWDGWRAVSTPSLLPRPYSVPPVPPFWRLGYAYGVGNPTQPNPNQTNSFHLFLSAWCMSITPIPPPAGIDCSGWLMPCFEAPNPAGVFKAVRRDGVAGAHITPQAQGWRQPRSRAGGTACSDGTDIFPPRYTVCLQQLRGPLGERARQPEHAVNGGTCHAMSCHAQPLS